VTEICHDLTVITRPRVLDDPLAWWLMMVVIGLSVTWLGLEMGAPRGRLLIDLLVSWAFAGAGALAISRWGPGMTPMLMLLVAVWWWLPTFSYATWSGLWTVAELGSTLGWAALVHLTLTYPGGKPWSPAGRLVIRAAYYVSIASSALLVVSSRDERNVLGPASAGPWRATLETWEAAAWLAVAVATGTLMVSRLAHLRGASRRLAFPVLSAALIGLPITIGLLVATLAGRPDIADRYAGPAAASVLLIPTAFVADLVWRSLRRSQASTLVVELRAGGEAPLRDRLARVLGDPTLELAFRVGDDWVDPQGQPVGLEESEQRAVTQILAGGLPVAALIHDRALLADRDLVASVRATTEFALDNERLAAEVRMQLAEVKASRTRLVAAQDDERRRLERDLHDGAQQRLVGLSLKLESARLRSTDAAGSQTLLEAQNELATALGELREFARGVHPTVLMDEGLDAAIEALARRAPVPVEVVGTAGRRLPEADELAVYYFVSECLTNVAKHAAASFVTISLRATGERVVVSVSDDGVGAADPVAGTGLRGLSDRLAALGGTLRIASGSGEGTTITAELPCRL
jgi:signal transduction histidine kinase